MRTAILLLFFILSKLTFAQEPSAGFFRDFNFIIHLTKNSLHEEAEKERERIFKDPALTNDYRDSVNFFLGQYYLKSGRINDAKKRFLQISTDDASFYYKGRFSSAIIYAEENSIDSAISLIRNTELSTSADINQLKFFQLAGLGILKRDYAIFDSVKGNVAFTNPVLVDEFQHLEKSYLAEKKIKRKSALVAGAMSAVVPGLGKVYVGNNGQALASFLSCALMGGVAFENYYRLGAAHPQTIFFASLFSVFYIGNIWGSAVSVQVAKIEKQNENHHNILVSLKLPVRNFFN